MQGLTHPVIKDVVLVGAGHAHVTVLRMFGMRPMPGVRFTLITPRGAHALFRHAAGPDRRPLRLRRRPYRHRPARALRRRAALSGRGHRPRSRRTARALPRPAAGAVRSALAQYRLDAQHRGLCRARPSTPSRSSRSTASCAGSRRCMARVLARRGPHAAGAGRRRRRRRRAPALGRAPAAARGRARRASIPAGCRSRSSPTRPTSCRAFRQHSASASTPSSPQRGIAVVDRRARHPRRGRAARARRRTAGRCRRDPVDHAGRAGALAGRDRTAARRSAASPRRRHAARRGPRRRVCGRRHHRVRGRATAEVRRLRRARRAGARRQHPPHPDRAAAAAVPPATRGALSGLDRRAHAIGTRNGLVFEGDWVWRWKDWIDRRFMRKFNELAGDGRTAAGAPTSPLADRQALKEISAIAMRCGGCGAKVGATVLVARARRDRAGRARRRRRRPRRAG